MGGWRGRSHPAPFSVAFFFFSPSTLPFSDEFLVKIGRAGYGKGNRMYRVESGKARGSEERNRFNQRVAGSNPLSVDVQISAVILRTVHLGVEDSPLNHIQLF